LLLVFGRNKYNLHDKIANNGSFRQCMCAASLCMCVCASVCMGKCVGAGDEAGRGTEASAGSLSQTKLHTKTINCPSNATTIATNCNEIFASKTESYSTLE